jgi:hypothetical protein
MAKKSIVEQFRDFVGALPAEGNEPMTRDEIAIARVKKKAKGARAKRVIKAPKSKKKSKKTAIRDKVRKSKKAKRR